ncbi:hypothetical protein PO909_020842, partial [Leuciscus waleckii]
SALLRKTSAVDFLRSGREKRAVRCQHGGCSSEDSEAEELLEANSDYEQDNSKMFFNGGSQVGEHMMVFKVFLLPPHGCHSHRTTAIPARTPENLGPPDTTSCDCVWRPWWQVARRCQTCTHGEVSAIPWETECFSDLRNQKAEEGKPGPYEQLSGGNGTPWRPTIKEQYKLCREESVY